MSTHLEQLIEKSAATNRFSPKSRYHQLPLAALTGPDGREIRYVKRRFIPPPRLDPNDPVHVVTAGERPDHLANDHLGDPELSWQLFDHNLTQRPWELTRHPGSAVRLPADGGTGNAAAFFPI
jgi:hypothetical protein